MDFIERLFNVSPDNGSGFTEFVILVALLVMLPVVKLLSQRMKAAIRNRFL
jgi:hypothetical protein